jgi:hypothetical protein
VPVLIVNVNGKVLVVQEVEDWLSIVRGDAEVNVDYGAQAKAIAKRLRSKTISLDRHDQAS